MFDSAKYAYHHADLLDSRPEFWSRTPLCDGWLSSLATDEACKRGSDNMSYDADYGQFPTT